MIRSAVLAQRLAHHWSVDLVHLAAVHLRGVGVAGVEVRRPRLRTSAPLHIAVDTDVLLAKVQRNAVIGHGPIAVACGRHAPGSCLVLDDGPEVQPGPLMSSPPMCSVLESDPPSTGSSDTAMDTSTVSRT